MGRRPLCPDGNKKKKKKKSSETDKDKDMDMSTGKETKNKRNTSPGGGSAHRDQFTIISQQTQWSSALMKSSK